MTESETNSMPMNGITLRQLLPILRGPNSDNMTIDVCLNQLLPTGSKTELVVYNNGLEHMLHPDVMDAIVTNICIVEGETFLVRVKVQRCNENISV